MLFHTIQFTTLRLPLSNLVYVAFPELLLISFRKKSIFLLAYGSFQQMSSICQNLMVVNFEGLNFCEATWV